MMIADPIVDDIVKAVKQAAISRDERDEQPRQAGSPPVPLKTANSATSAKSVTSALSGEKQQPKAEWDDAGAFPKLRLEDFHGIAGQIVRTMLPHTEADAAAMLFQILAIAGNLIGRNAFIRVGGKKHHTNIFVVVVGKSAKARKGQSLDDVLSVFEAAMPEELAQVSQWGLASGEGLVAAVADEKDEDGNLIPKMQKKVVFCQEFSSIFKLGRRENSILTEILRAAFDCAVLQNPTKKNPCIATQAMITLIGHITEHELHETCDLTAIFNGFANRSLWICAQRSKVLSSGGRLNGNVINNLATTLRKCIEDARKITEIQRSDEAEVVWDRLYRHVAGVDEDGGMGSVLARGEPILLRLSMLCALLDGSAIIEIKHLREAWAAWEYAEASARRIFGKRLSNGSEIKLLEAARQAFPKGIDGKAQDNATNCRGTKAARESLTRRGLIKVVKSPSSIGKGNPAIIVFAVPSNSADFTEVTEVAEVTEIAEDFFREVTPEEIKQKREEIAALGDTGNDGDEADV